MRYLALPFFCAVVVSLLLALLSWALRNQDDAVALACAIGVVFFAWRSAGAMHDISRSCQPTTSTEQRPAGDSQAARLPDLDKPVSSEAIKCR